MNIAQSGPIPGGGYASDFAIKQQNLMPLGIVMPHIAAAFPEAAIPTMLRQAG